MSDSLYGTMRTRTFAEIFPDSTAFSDAYVSNGIPQTIGVADLNTLYYLLYASYGNSHICSSDENRFQYAVFSKVFQYAPNWLRKLQIQETLRGLSEEQLMEGSRQVFNNAENPGTDPGTYTDSELQYINSQNVTKTKKAKLDAYNMLYHILADDITKDFISKFKELFRKIVLPENMLLYAQEEDQ